MDEVNLKKSNSTLEVANKFKNAVVASAQKTTGAKMVDLNNYASNKSNKTDNQQRVSSQDQSSGVAPLQLAKKKSVSTVVT